MALIQRWNKSKDPEAFTEIIHRYAGLVYGACLRVLRNADDAEDVAQECFMRLGKAPVQVTTSFAGWLHTMATRRAINRLRTNARRNARERTYAETRPRTSDAAWDDVQHLIDEAVAGLPDELRIPLVEHYLLGRTMESIGEEIGISRQAISRRVQKGVDKIRVELRGKGVPVAPAVLAGGFVEFGKASPTAELQRGLLNSAVGGIDAGTLEQVAATKTTAAMFSPLAYAVVAALFVAGALGLWAAERSSHDVPISPLADVILPVAVQSEVEEESTDTPEEQVIPPVTSPVEKLLLQLATVAEEEPKQRGISGMVVLEKTKVPIAGVEVELIEKRDQQVYPPETKSETGADGIFEFPEADPMSLLALRLGWPYRYTTDSFTQTVWVDRAQDYFVIEAREQGAVTGYVRDPDGSPVHRARIARSYFFEGSTSIMGYSDESGRFGFAHDGGTWRIKAMGTLGLGIESELMVFDLIQGDNVKHDFILPKSAAIHLSITKPDGRAPASIRRGKVRFDKAEKTRRIHFNDDPFMRTGELFTLPLLNAGNYTLTVEVNGFEPAVVGPITIPQELTDQYASIALRPVMVAAKPGKDLSEVDSRPETDEPDPVTITFNIQDAYANPLGEAGTFIYAVNEWGSSVDSSQGLTLWTRPGTYWLIAVKEGYTADVQYASVSEESNITFTLGERGAIHGSLPQPSERKLSVLPLDLWELFGEPSGIGQIDRSRRGIGTALAQGAQPDENGSFALPYLPEGWYVVMSDSAASAPVEVRAGHETGPIHLAPATLPAADVSQ